MHTSRIHICIITKFHLVSVLVSEIEIQIEYGIRGTRIFVIDICVIMTSVKTAGAGDEHECALPLPPPQLRVYEHARNRVVTAAYKQVSRTIMRRTLTAIELAQ